MAQQELKNTKLDVHLDAIEKHKFYSAHHTNA
jgi:hypothetical protein